MTYWEKRQQELNRAMEKDEAALKKRLSSYFDTEFARLDREIAAYYQRYGVDNVIQYRTLMESLSEADRRLLMEKMDKFAARYPEYAHLMPVRESIYRLNRLEGLQYSIRMQQLEIGAVENKEITAYLNKQAERGVNAAAEALGFGKNFYANNPDISKLFVNTAWSNGQNFSQRIWGNTSKLAEYLNTDIAQGIARGDSYDRLVRQLRARFGKVSRNDAYRLIYTEGTYVMAESSMQPFLEDFEQYRLSTVGDGKVCEICREVAKHVFDIKNRKPGTNFPPLHPWCRCTFTIEVADWDKWMEDYERRHGNGQAEKVAGRLGGEMELSPRKATGGDYGVDWPKIQSTEYRESLEKLSGNKKVVDAIETRARWALNNRDGLKTEELYAISLDTGEEIASILGQQLESRVERTKVFAQKLDAADSKGERILLIHNHPRGYPPSIGDINALYQNKNVSGITVGHDGSLYYYTRPQRIIDPDKFRVALMKNSRYTEITGQEKALEDLTEQYGFVFEKL